MSSESEDTSASRRRFLQQAAAAAAGTALVSSAGCLDLFGLGGGRPGGVSGGAIPHRQEIQAEDADVAVGSEGDLREQVDQQDGRVIWVPADAEIDLTGDDLYIENVVVASGRGEGERGGVIFSEDVGSNSPTWDGGSTSRGLIELGNNARLTGLEIRGPHHSVQDHPQMPSYIPFAPQSSRSARDAWRAERYARGVSVRGHNVTIDNCEIWAFATQAIAVGASQFTPENTVISHCHVHNALMSSLGYGVDVRHGHPQIHRCYFDACRHCVNGSGFADAGYYLTESIIAPWVSNFPIDMHGVHDNIDGTTNPDDRNYRWRAGGTMVVRNCDIMPTHVPDLGFINRRAGNQTPHVHVRAVPEDGFFFENNRCAHSDPQTALNQSGIQGVYSPNEEGYRNLYYSGNQWGVDFNVEVP